MLLHFLENATLSGVAVLNVYKVLTLFQTGHRYTDPVVAGAKGSLLSVHHIAICVVNGDAYHGRLQQGQCYFHLMTLCGVGIGGDERCCWTASETAVVAAHKDAIAYRSRASFIGANGEAYLVATGRQYGIKNRRCGHCVAIDGPGPGGNGCARTGGCRIEHFDIAGGIKAYERSSAGVRQRYSDQFVY